MFGVNRALDGKLRRMTEPHSPPPTPFQQPAPRGSASKLRRSIWHAIGVGAAVAAVAAVVGAILGFLATSPAGQHGCGTFAECAGADPAFMAIAGAAMGALVGAPVGAIVTTVLLVRSADSASAALKRVGWMVVAALVCIVWLQQAF